MDTQNWSSLINFQNIPGGCISGMEGREIESMAQRSMLPLSDETYLIKDDINDGN